MEDIAAEISAVKAEIFAVKTEIAGIKTEIAGMKSKRDEKGLSDPEQTELTTLKNKEIALTNEKAALTTKEAALTNEKVELLKRLPLPGIHSVSMPYFINNQ
jgi:chromosome segregation ATPase